MTECARESCSMCLVSHDLELSVSVAMKIISALYKGLFAMDKSWKL